MVNNNAQLFAIKSAQVLANNSTQVLAINRAHFFHFLSIFPLNVQLIIPAKLTPVPVILTPFQGWLPKVSAKTAFFV